MKAYADTSLLVAAFTRENGSETAIAWLQALPSGDLMTSKWCHTEIESALAIKVRVGALMPADLPTVSRTIHDMLANIATLVPMTDAHFDAAADLIRRSLLPLRGADALHLAIAQSCGATLWAFDRAMLAAATDLGLDARRPH